MQKKTVINLYKTLVACKQKGNINKQKVMKNTVKNFNVCIINKNNKIHVRVTPYIHSRMLFPYISMLAMTTFPGKTTIL